MLRKFFLLLFLSCYSLIDYSQTHDLDFYLSEGLKNSPLLNDFRNQTNAAISDSLLIRSAKKPYIEANSQLLYSPAYNNWGYEEVITDGGNYTAVMGVSQKIFNKRELENKYKAVDLQKQLVNNSTLKSTAELSKMITEQYLTSYSTLTDVLFNETFLQLFKKEIEIVKQFVASGTGKQTDYLSLLIETQSQEVLVSQLKSQYRNDLMLLNQLCGITDSVWYDITEPQIVIKGNPDITKSPYYIQYKIDSVRIENEKAAIDIRYKPKVNWFADAGFLTSNPWNFYQHFGYSAGVSLNIPVYDGNQRAIEKQKLDLDENSRKGYEISYYKQYHQQIQQLKIELQSLNDMSVRIEKQLATSDQLVKALKEQLESGNIEMTEYINAIKNYRTTSRNLNLINIQKLQVINEMNLLLTQQ
jgi:outer membrane protein TolC